MSMATMNPVAAGGPVGGMIMMNNGSPAVGGDMRENNDQTKLNLNGYIYDYLLKQGHYDVARAMSQDNTFQFSRKSASPGRRKDAEMNGDADGMDVDAKDDAPDELPRPRGWDGTSGNGFLLDWFAIFTDLFAAHRGNNAKNAAGVYIQHERTNQKLRDSMQNQNINRQNMNPAMMQQMRANMVNGGKMPGQVTPQQLQAMQQKRAQAQMMHMARAEQGEGDMNGVRPSTPAEGDATGSPSKRPRMDNGQQNFPQGMMPNGRPAGVPGGPNAGGMLMQTGFAPNGMPQQFRQNGAMPPKTMPGNMPNGMMNMNMANAGSPMMNQFGDGMQSMDVYNRQNMPGGQGMQGGGAAAQSGNHALQDYQMQLMLLEQQNKKRLMMARQEQHENNPGAAGMPGVNMPAGMSPSGRSGTSPNPEMAGRSPSAMAGFNMPGNNFDAGMFMKNDTPMMNPNMRPPTSNMPPGGRPGQFPGGQPMQQQGSQPGQQLGTPGQRTDMPPPQAPANGAQRGNGNSPQNQNQPPTPSQTNKANPKNKKNAAKEENKKRPTKKGSVAQNDDNPPATPTPSTPITPNNPGAANSANKGQPNMQQTQPQQNMMNQQPMQQNGMDNFDFGGGAANGPEFNLDFSTLENADVLENFDFDSFLNTSADDTFNFTGDVDLGNDFSMDAGQ